MIHRPALILLIATLLLAGPIAAATAATITGFARISDGDTITIKGTRIRLNGIDAPETGQVCIDATEETYPCGIAARDALTGLIQGHPVSCTGNETDRYGRRIMLGGVALEIDQR